MKDRKGSEGNLGITFLDRLFIGHALSIMRAQKKMKIIRIYLGCVDSDEAIETLESLPLD